jgi:hypothetical protein
MSPTSLSATILTTLTPDEIARQMLLLESWPDFHGYGPLPGIKSATFRKKTDDIIGTQIAVSNRDGSSHIEEITSWLPNDIVLEMKEFSPPLSKIASHFIERWTFIQQGSSYEVRRGFILHHKNLPGAFALRLIAPLMRRAVERHLRQITQR